MTSHASGAGAIKGMRYVSKVRPGTAWELGNQVAEA